MSEQAGSRTPTSTRARKRTRQGSAVEQALLGMDGFRSAQDIFAELRSQGLGVGLSTVYRQLKGLAENGQADVIYTPAGEAQYRLCGETSEGSESAHHHHHVVCRECGFSVEVEAPEVEEWADRVAQSAGFTEVSHVVDVFGLCPRHSG